MSAQTRIWVVCQQPARRLDPAPFVVCAICATERLGVNLCTTPRHFLGPLDLDRLIPATVQAWEGALLEGTRFASSSYDAAIQTKHWAD